MNPDGIPDGLRAPQSHEQPADDHPDAKPLTEALRAGYLSAVDYGDAYIELHAQAWDAILPGWGIGDILRNAWVELARPLWTHALCDCDPATYHRWNCSATPLWSQTIRDLDCNPWTVIRPRDLAMVVGMGDAA